MTYKEACEEIDRLCEDWGVRYSNHKLESVAYNLNAKESIEKIREFAHNVFDKATNGVLSVEVDPSEVEAAYVFNIVLRSRRGYKREGFSNPWSGIPVKQLTKEQFTHTFFQDVQHVLGRALTSDDVEDLSDLSEITRGIVLAELAMEQNDFFATLQAELIERGEECRRFNTSSQAYSEWRTSVGRAMMNAATAWIKETSLVPGMKIAIRDLNRCCYVVKTLKALSQWDSAVSLELTDGSCVPNGGPTFYKEGTWLVNNDHYREIAVALDFLEAKRF